MRLIELVFDYLIAPLSMIFMGLLCGLWWKLYVKEQPISVFTAGFLLLTLYACVYKMGYKGTLKQRGMRGYYYIVFVTPAFLATASFIYGVLKYVLYLI